MTLSFPLGSDVSQSLGLPTMTKETRRVSIVTLGSATLQNMSVLPPSMKINKNMDFMVMTMSIDVCLSLLEDVINVTFMS